MYTRKSSAHGSRVQYVSLSVCAVLFLFFLSVGKIQAESRYSASVRKTLTSAYAQKDQSLVIASLVAGAAKAGTADDRKAILVSLADFEERNGMLSAAAKQYNDAAFVDPKVRDDGCILDAARCSFMSGDQSAADGLVRAVLLTCFDDKILVRARVYAAWIQLSSSDASVDSGGALSLIRSYADNNAFSAYAPALLFTLWWVDGDSAAQAKLLSAFPGSPEASILRGEMQLAATPFWYLIGRNAGKVTEFARAGSASLTGTPSGQPAFVPPPPASPDTSSRDKAPAVVAATAAADSVPPDSASASVVDNAPASSAGASWQQAGFFRNREYAADLRDKLAKLGFNAIIREEKRPSGTVYFSVLVPDDAQKTTAARLKDAGFESYLVQD